MDSLYKYAEELRREFASSNMNMDRAADLCRTFNELYSNTNNNLVNTILYPESTLPTKYPSEWYRPTATFRLTNTYTIQPRNGKFFIRFFPNMLFTESSKQTSLDVIFDNLDGEQFNLSSITNNADTLMKTLNINNTTNINKNLSTSIILKNPSLGKSINNNIYNNKNSVTNSIRDTASSFLSAKSKDISSSLASYLKSKGSEALSSLKSSNLGESFISGVEKVMGNQDFAKLTEQQIENLLESTLGLGHSINNLRIDIPDNIIETYRCNAASISVKCENNQGALFGAITYFNSEDNGKLKQQTEKFTQNFSNFSQEWIHKIEEDPANGIRLIKTPKDASDHAFRYTNQVDSKCEHVLLAAGTGLDDNGTIIIDITQHIEFIPVTKMLDFFTPTIPMFSLNSKDMFSKATASFPIIGRNGGLLINSPAKMQNLMEYLNKKKKSDYRMNLWNILTDSSFVSDNSILRAIDNTLS